MDINRNERLFDSMLEVAAEEAMLQRMDSLPTCEELDKMYPLSAELDSRIKKIITKEARYHKRKNLLDIFMKVAACIGITFIAGSIMLMSVEASRNFIFNTIINIRHDHVALEFTNNESSELNTNINMLGGFEYVGSQTLDHIIISSYTNLDNEQIIVSQHYGINLGTAIDIEYREFTTIYLNGQQIFLFEAMSSQEHTIAIWQKNGIVFQVHTYVDVQEVLLFVNSLL